MPVVDIQDLTVEYPTPDYVVRPLDGFSRTLDDGTLTLVLGPSGCGKTTLLSCLGGLLRPTSGAVMVGDTDVGSLDEAGLVQYRRSQIGFVFQSFNLLASLDARQNVAAPLIAHGVRRREAFLRADLALREVGMEDYAHKRPGQLSGGQQQRVAVARGVVNDPEILLADEPTANLDYVQAEGVIQVLRGLARPGRIVIIASHDDRLLPIADQLIELTPSVDETREPEGTVALAAGEILFTQGDRGAFVYEVAAGTIELVQGTGSDQRVVRQIGPGIYFGELGAMMAQPRTATARATTDAVVREMTLPEFRARQRGVAHAATEAEDQGQASTPRRRRTPLRAD